LFGLSGFQKGLTGMDVTTKNEAPDNQVRTGVSQSFDWYSEGESRTVEVDGIRVEVKYVGRKGRRARIAITAPAAAVFRERDVAARAFTP
jgi:hypothetical protein